ncbi:MAG: ABC transporter permease, partial [Candidatus Electrothrix sp. AR4]|nr:ABC transporter permease [Candidatus Electrothrix sp. AR4]
WFGTGEGKDEGLLQGNMGRSMMDLKPVNDKFGDRLLFTFLISLSTILFTWAIAFPIGIYSAVRQYSFFDYIFTVAGFIGMCIPGFLLALLLMFAAESWFGISVSGLFSPEYAAQTEWSQGKIMDLLRHIWLPVFVQGVAGTAGMIRVMRANLLDELKKPYVITARAKGVRPMRLLFKYPIRLALNPFISGIGGIFPELISGGAIIAIVLSLPTIEPMQLNAVMQQDMYLAGSILMLLSLLSVLGTLFSDILLLIFDPRIRTAGGAK